MSAERTYVIGSRQTGKTTRLLEWLAEGEETSRYPGWSRILIVTSIPRVLRLRGIIRATDPPLLEDDAHRIYHLEDWQTGMNLDPSVEVAIDDLDEFLSLRIVGRLAMASMTGRVEEATAARVTLRNGIPGVWVCEFCGQPVAESEVCNSGLHVAPGQEANGAAVHTSDLAAMLYAYREFFDAVSDPGSPVTTGGRQGDRGRLARAFERVAEADPR